MTAGAAFEQGSGDPVLDRRREWALAASAEGFHEGAADIYQQIVEQAPHWALAWFELGAAREKLGDRPAAIDAFRQAQLNDPRGLLAAELRLAALGAIATPAAPPQAYVASLFDQYAKRFDEHLTRTLDYRGPEVLMDAILRACALAGREAWFDVALDLGCGTGLMARELARCCDVIDGVDLSARMIEAAQLTGLYHELATGDVTGFLNGQMPGRPDLAAAADVFVYLGDLQPVFAAARRVLDERGLLAFTLQRHDGAQDYMIGGDMRYAHSPACLRAWAAQTGFTILLLEEVSVRKDRGEPVAGLVCVAIRD